MNEASQAIADTCLPVKFTESEKSHFWSKVEKTDGCWLWKAGKQSRGYGMYYLRQKLMGAHRVSWMMANEKLIPRGMQICHHCDNPQCCRPDHLFIGTCQDNADDKCRKGRQAKGDSQGLRKHPGLAARGDRHGSVTHPESIPRGDNHHSRRNPERMARGERNASSILTEADVQEIRRLGHQFKMRHRDIAAIYKCTRRTIGHILCGKTWRHVA